MVSIDILEKNPCHLEYFVEKRRRWIEIGVRNVEYGVLSGTDQSKCNILAS